MFLKESKETNNYVRSSKFGKHAKYTRTKTITHWECDKCFNEFTKVKNGPYNATGYSYCNDCVTKFGVGKLAGEAGSKVRDEKNKSKINNITVASDGYKEIYVGKNYTHRPGSGCIREHIYIMEMYLNRPLKKGEIVHHIDGNKKNNQLDNLFLTTVQEHNKMHACSESIIFELVKRELVIFNREIGRYELKI